MKASDRLGYNQKQAKFKHNCHLFTGVPGTLSLKTTYICFPTNRVARGVRFSPNFRMYPSSYKSERVYPFSVTTALTLITKSNG